MTSLETLSSRPIRIATDGPPIYELTTSVATAIPHVVDLPYRLASPSAQRPDVTQLWRDGAGELVAWAILQFPWLSVDYAVRPDYRADGFEDEVLTWAVERLTVETAQRGQRLHYFVSARPDDHARVAAIERAGFVRQEWSYVGLQRDLSHPLPAAELPSGFVIRPLAGAAEVGAYVQAHRGAFGTTSMTEEWRRAMLTDPHYLPDLDLIALAPDGTVAGFCICWLATAIDGQRVAQIEPLGVSPAYQRLGLGRALLLAAMKRATERGAEAIRVYAESYNKASQGVYAAVGFQEVDRLAFYLRVFSSELSAAELR